MCNLGFGLAECLFLLRLDENIMLQPSTLHLCISLKDENEMITQLSWYNVIVLSDTIQIIKYFLPEVYSREMNFECPLITECLEANIALNSLLSCCWGHKRDANVVAHFLFNL